MESLPKDVVFLIIYRLSLVSIARLQRVCKFLSTALEDDQMWAQLVVRRLNVSPLIYPGVPRRLAYFLAQIRSAHSDNKQPMIIRKNAWRGSISNVSLKIRLDIASPEPTFQYTYRSSFTSDYGDESGNWCTCRGKVTAAVRPISNPAEKDAPAQFNGVPTNHMLELQLIATEGTHGDFESGFPDDVRGSVVDKVTKLVVCSPTVLQRYTSEHWPGVPEMLVIDSESREKK